MVHQQPNKMFILKKTALKLDKKKVKNLKFPPIMSKMVIVTEGDFSC
jgi:hypothetical protein